MTTIGINLLFLEPGRVGGSETLVRQWLKRMDMDLAKKTKVIVYCTETFSKTVDFKNIILREVLKNSKSRAKRLFYELIILPLLLIKDRVDLLHSMGYTSPIFTHCRKIVSIHDTQYASVPETLSFLTRIAYSILMPLVTQSNDYIITVSFFSKKEIVRHLGVSARKISVIYEASDIEVDAPTKIEARKNYIMTASATHPHKNIDKLVEAFGFLIKKPTFSGLKLVITGFAAKGHDRLTNTIAKLKLRKKVKFLGWKSRGEYLRLLRNSLLFVFPSSYEGFGLPPLEAMACGTPVIASSKGSLAEVLGDAALIIKNPKDPREIARKMEELLSNKKKYNLLVKRGQAKAKMFSWDKSYNELLEVYAKFFDIQKTV